MNAFEKISGSHYTGTHVSVRFYYQQEVGNANFKRHSQEIVGILVRIWFGIAKRNILGS